MRFDITAYRYKFTDLQVSNLDQATITYLIRNAASSRTQGVEASLQWRATEALTLNGAFGYNRAKYLQFTGNQCYATQTVATGCVGAAQGMAGKSRDHAPKLSFNLGANYNWELANSWVVQVSGDGSYSGSYFSEATQDPLMKQDSFWRVNAALRLRSPNEKYELAVIGRNLTNSYYLIIAGNRTFGGPTEFNGQFARPREVLVQALVKF